MKRLNKKHQKIYAVIISLTAILMAYAGPPAPPPPGAPFRTITIRLINGTAISAGATKNLEITTDSMLRVGTGLTLLEYPLKEVAGWDLNMSDSITVGLPSLKDRQTVSFHIQDNTLIISGAKPDTPVILSNAKGLSQVMTMHQNTLSINLGRLSKGIYIISADGRSMKFNVR